jgi:hypothetical protein
VVLPRGVRVEVGEVSRLLTIDDSRPAFDAILSSGKARVRVRVDHRYTDSEFQRRAVVLDETREMAVAVRERPRPGP